MGGATWIGTVHESQRVGERRIAREWRRARRALVLSQRQLADQIAFIAAAKRTLREMGKGRRSDRRASKMGDPGSSDYTPEKEAYYGYAAGVLLNIIQRIQRKHPWVSRRVVVVELNAGDGGTPDVPGSPLVVAGIAETLGIGLDLWCCEQNPDSLARLTLRFVERDWQHVVPRFLLGDHAETIKQVLTHYRGVRPGSIYGWLYADNNNGTLPVAAIQGVFAEPAFRCVDVLATIAGNGAYKRARAVYGRRLSDDIAAIPKTRRFIRNKRTPWQWSMLLMTNWPDMKELRKIDMVDLDGPEGRARLDELDYTGRERENGGRGKGVENLELLGKER